MERRIERRPVVRVWNQQRRAFGRGWNGDGYDEIGVQRGNQFWLDRNGNGVWDGNAGGDRLYTFRNVGDKPLVGDWDGDGDDEIGSWNAGLFYIDLNSNGVWDGTASR